MNKYKKYVGQLNRLKLKHGFHTLQLYRTGRIKNIRGENSTEPTRRLYAYKLDRLRYCRYQFKVWCTIKVR